MNYLKLILAFWKLRRSKRITSVQTDLYFFLLQECNERGWENPFECTNGVIMASIDIAKSTFQDARNRLQQLGLIEFENGVRNTQAPSYFIIESMADNRPRNRPKTGTVTGHDTGEPPEHYINKLNKTKRKLNSDTNVSGADNSDSKKSKPKAGKPPRSGAPPPEDVTPHWNRLKSDWIQFYKSKNNDVEPTFKGREAKALQEIASRLQKLTAAAPGTAMHQWTENYAAKVFQHFLMKAWAVEWRRTNFMLHILSSHFDAIIQTDETGNSKAGNKPATGGNVSVTSAFDKIDQMHSAAGNTGSDISQN